MNCLMRQKIHIIDVLDALDVALDVALNVALNVALDALNVALDVLDVSIYIIILRRAREVNSRTVTWCQEWDLDGERKTTASRIF